MKEYLKYYLLKVSLVLISDSFFHKCANYYLHLRNGKIPKLLNLKNPITLNEKIIYNKINNRFDEGHILADKFEVRNFIDEIIGGKYLIPLIGVYENVDAIDFSELPNQFVIKITMGSGWNVIVEDKTKINIDELKKKLNRWLKMDYSIYGREWQYKSNTKKIIIEKYLHDTIETPLYDYKFFCFNGTPKLIQVDVDRRKKHKRNFYNCNWELQQIQLLYPNSSQSIPQPTKLNEMLQLVNKISMKLRNKMNFVRIDFYNYKDEIYFGEITFHPGGGCEPFTPMKVDMTLGSELRINFLD